MADHTEVTFVQDGHGNGRQVVGLVIPDDRFTGRPTRRDPFRRQRSSIVVCETLCARRFICFAAFFFIVTVLASFLCVLVISRTTNLFVADGKSVDQWGLRSQTLCRPCSTRSEAEQASRLHARSVPEESGVWRGCCVGNQGIDEVGDVYTWFISCVIY